MLIDFQLACPLRLRFGCFLRWLECTPQGNQSRRLSAGSPSHLWTGSKYRPVPHTACTSRRIQAWTSRVCRPRGHRCIQHWLQGCIWLPPKKGCIVGVYATPCACLIEILPAFRMWMDTRRGIYRRCSYVNKINQYKNIKCFWYTVNHHHVSIIFTVRVYSYFLLNSGTFHNNKREIRVNYTINM